MKVQADFDSEAQHTADGLCERFQLTAKFSEDKLVYHEIKNSKGEIVGWNELPLQDFSKIAHQLFVWVQDFKSHYRHMRMLDAGYLFDPFVHEYRKPRR